MSIKLGDVFVAQGKHYGFIVVEHPSRVLVVQNINEFGRSTVDRILYHVPPGYVLWDLRQQTTKNLLPWWVGAKLRVQEAAAGWHLGRTGAECPRDVSAEFIDGYHRAVIALEEALNCDC
jgi:hypothetical protein